MAESALSQNIGSANNIAGLMQFLFGKQQTQTTEGGTSTTQTQLSEDTLQRILQQGLESVQGLANVAQGQKTAGLYNATTNRLLVNDLMSRLATQAAVAGAPKVTTTTPQKVTTKTPAMIGKGTGLATLAALALGTQGGRDALTGGAKKLKDLVIGPDVEGYTSGDVFSNFASIAPDMTVGSFNSMLSGLASMPTFANAMSWDQNFGIPAASALSGMITDFTPAPYDFMPAMVNLGSSGATAAIPAGVEAGTGALDVGNVGAVTGSTGIPLDDWTSNLTGGEGAIDLSGVVTDGVADGFGLDLIGAAPSPVDLVDWTSNAAGGAESILDAGGFPVVSTISNIAQGDVGGLAGTAAGWALGGPVGGAIGNVLLGEGGIGGAMEGVGNVVESVVDTAGDVVDSIVEVFTGGCFITTAAVEVMGLQDDCVELQTLRQFRDTWLKENHPHEIETYYAEAPAIVEALKVRSDFKSLFTHFFENYIVPAVELINNGMMAEAHRTYVALFKLASRLSVEGEIHGTI